MRTYHALPAALLAALALTACDNGTGTQDEGAARPGPAATASTTPAADTPATESTGRGTTGASGTADSGGTSGGSNGGGSGPATGKTTGTSGGKATGKTGGETNGEGAPARVFCHGGNTTVTARPVPRPLNHLLITVENTGSKPCDLTYHPVLRFDAMQWAPRPVADSKPQAVTTLAPGEKGYAGVSLSAADGSGEAGTTGRRLTVGFQGRTPNSDGGPTAIPALPARGVYYDSTLAVTYWLRDMDDALSY
ncbi:DUF4232 domain-containing protein [Streptomyces sp. NPDC059720]|uniref:DUF4232 domain-containing protein n=1 Tax=Streptomyces sp. NPDC059720 TaxID=3346924 RepID=UPI0036D0717F